MNKPIFISYYTKDTIYQDAINKYLIPSLDKLKLRYYIYNIETLGDWKSNAIQKPNILMRALNDFPDNDIIWQDADSEVLREPTLLYNIPQEYDIAVHYLNWKAHYGKEGFEMLDGTVLWRNTEKVKDFLIALIGSSTNVGKDHQKQMSWMLDNCKSNGKGNPELELKVFPLPRTYSYLPIQPNGDESFIKIEDPVIVHHQLSRQAKKSLYKK